jgi:hypothetical protein
MCSAKRLCHWQQNDFDQKADKIYLWSMTFDTTEDIMTSVSSTMALSWLLFTLILTSFTLVMGHDNVVLNVKDYGVIGDGKNDDTRAMQALVSQPHSIVVVPANVTVKTGP